MKRVYSNENMDKKTELRKLVLEQLRKTRNKMKKDHPGLLENMREAIEANSVAMMKSTSANASSTEVQNSSSETLQIDHGKNLETIEKMLGLKQSNPGFEKAVKALISKKKH